MMEGLDETFDAVLFVGYHAKAGTADAIIDHTMSGNVMNVAVNGVSLPEAGINALMAGHYDVPIAFVAGDQAVCDQVEGLFGEVETVAVKEGIGAASLSVHPEVGREMVRAGVERRSIQTLQTRCTLHAGFDHENRGGDIQRFFLSRCGADWRLGVDLQKR